MTSLDKHAESAADLIDGSIGELSIFQETIGYYAQGVTPDTAILPKGWRRRLVAYHSPATNGVTAMCLEAHDLWLSKAAAGRPKDKEFCRAMLTRRLVQPDTLTERMRKMPIVDDREKERILAWAMHKS